SCNGNAQETQRREGDVIGDHYRASGILRAVYKKRVASDPCASFDFVAICAAAVGEQFETSDVEYAPEIDDEDLRKSPAACAPAISQHVRDPVNGFASGVGRLLRANGHDGALSSDVHGI